MSSLRSPLTLAGLCTCPGMTWGCSACRMCGLLSRAVHLFLFCVVGSTFRSVPAGQSCSVLPPWVALVLQPKLPDLVTCPIIRRPISLSLMRVLREIVFQSSGMKRDTHQVLPSVLLATAFSYPAAL